MLHDFHQVLIVDLNVGAVQSHNVFWLDESIMILVDFEEGFIDRVEATRYFLAKYLVELTNSRLHLCLYLICVYGC